MFSCGNKMQCERHYLPKGFLGKVTIVYAVKNGQDSIDQNGCIVYHVPKSGLCLSSFKLKSGVADPNKTFLFFECVDSSCATVIREFDYQDYLIDSVHLKGRKFVFFTGSGYKDLDGRSPTYFFEYAVDLGSNHANYGPSYTN